MKLAPGRYEIDLADSKDRFTLDKDVVTIRRGDDAVVRVTFQRRVVAVSREDMRELGDQAVKWIAQHNALGPEEQIVADARSQILAETSQRGGFIYKIAGTLLKNDRATVVSVYGNRMLTNELSPEEAKLMGLADQPIAAFSKGYSIVGSRAVAPEFKLGSVTWDAPEEESPKRQIAGWASYKRLYENKENTKYWLRVTLALDQATTFYQGLAGDLASESGQLQIHFENPWMESVPTARGGLCRGRHVRRPRRRLRKLCRAQ